MQGNFSFPNESGGKIMDGMGVVKLDFGFGLNQFFQLLIDFPGVHAC